MENLTEIISSLEISPEFVEYYGRNKAKISLSALRGRDPKGKLILVSAITPTPSGEGKTTTSIGLAQGLKKRGNSVALALRQPSMGPVFGRKGGATGGGRSTLVPSDQINLQFTGDFSAISAAHNLLAAVIDNALHFGKTDLDPRSVLWKRVMDMNDRALRRIVIGLGGPKEGVPRETGFDITAASEVMAILCLSESFADLQARLECILVGYTRQGSPVYAKELGVTGAMAACLKDALLPNLVQSCEGVPAFVHGGPFANIAHGCNSVLGTRMALSHADYAVTEAGFAVDLGAEKFFDIKCRSAGLNPSCVVIVATVRALKMHGGVALNALTSSDPKAVARGLPNLAAHLEGISHFGKPVVVAINHFSSDHGDEIAVIEKFCNEQKVPVSVARVFERGGEGALELAETVVKLCNRDSVYRPLYPLDWPFLKKVETIARLMYGADGVVLTQVAEAKLRKAEVLGFDKLPVCMAKTPDSLSDNPKLQGRPKNFTLTIRDIEIASGAGFLVALTGEILRMPGLPQRPAALDIYLSEDAEIQGLH